MRNTLVLTTMAAFLSGCGGGGSADDGGTAPPPSAVQYTASSQSSSGGKLSPASLSIESGKQGSFSIAAEQGYVLDTITGCNGSINTSASGSSYTTGAMSADCTIKASFITNAANAIRKEDHSLASDAELITHAQAAISASEIKRKALVDSLFQGISTVNWHPSHDSITFTSFLPERTLTLLPSNQNGSGNPEVRGLVMVSEEGNNRSAAMAANLFSVSTSSDTDLLLKRLIGWLTKGKDQTDGLSIVTAQMPSRADSWYFPHNEGIRTWLANNYANAHSINDANACDYNELSACIDNLKPDLIILSDIDRKALGHDGIAAAVAKAKAAGIPLLLSNYWRNASPMLSPLYQQMGLVTYGNYWSKLNASELAVSSIRADDTNLMAVNTLLDNLKNADFTTAHLDSCNGNFLGCDAAPFVENFKAGADWLRNAAITLDSKETDAFDLGDADTLKASLLLADKYRAAIDYPIGWDEHQSWQQAMFADWLINYARQGNAAQPDLGEYVTDRSKLAKGSNASYAHPAKVTERKTIGVPYPNQWTTTGWYVLPGQTVTLTRHDSSPAGVEIKLNYHRRNTNRAFEQKVYRAPLELATQRLPLNAGSSISFSSPYGGPLYLYLDGAEGALKVDISASGITRHPSIMNFSDEAQIQQFNERLSQTELPHVDLRTDGAEQHMRRDRFTNAIGGAVPDVSALLKSVAEDHINAVYNLAGFKIQGKTLAESLPADVKAACVNMIGNECLDATLHTRSIIQHANYDQNAHCGSGCSGNPWDAAWNISPTGWGDNHELGHNLQVNRLNVQYAAAVDADNWAGYGSRAGENSNNIFPYVVKWQAHYVRDGNSNVITDGHMNHKDLFYVFMSDAAKVKNSSGNRVVLGANCKVLDAGDSRYEAPWKSNSYAVHNGYRMAFYIQMALRAHGMELADGTRLANGFNIFTLLYQHQRIFGALSGNQANWDANKDRLGFGLFPFEGHSVYGGRKVRDIPGNDFMLASLSKLTGLNWQSHFDMLGLRYSSLAATQAQANATKGTLAMGMYVLETDLPPANMSEGLSFLPLSVDDAATTWRDGNSPASCPPVQ
ncbi:ImpA family metalloprotease [Shewanella sp. JM162201]|uniref:ImpA family metalloprotease n=1 Tax=Shewanella jiangmenensis TaxID=2837387 RepID=A0ABS5V0S2_9GAMM|nr:ImpA family metalloprotease [Shewanella jiangmenensis]MBT1444030.1 ImpA family metalloprotease [Shewanella jiangmenensis]